MKLAIEISSYDKEWITNGYYIPEEINMKISEAIANGTPLPKGHGRLIDADKCYPDISVVLSPTVIEADKESET